MIRFTVPTITITYKKHPHHTSAKYGPTERHALKFDYNNTSQHSSKFDHKFEGRPYQPSLQQGGDTAPNDDPDFKALLERPWKSYRLDDVD